MSSPTVASLALLKVNYDLYGSDYLEQFVPLIAECIREASVGVVSVPELQGTLKLRFGLSFPQHAIAAILTRIRKRGYVYLDNHVLKPNSAKLAALKFRPVQETTLRGYEAIIEHLLTFSRDQMHVSWSSDDAEDALQSYIKGLETSVVASLGNVAPIVPFDKRMSRSTAFVVGSFIQSLHEQDHSDLSYLDSVVKGTMIAHGLYLSDPGSIQRKFRNTQVYFDTSFLLRALGYSGDALQSPELEVLDLLVRVWCRPEMLSSYDC